MHAIHVFVLLSKALGLIILLFLIIIIMTRRNLWSNIYFFFFVVYVFHLSFNILYIIFLLNTYIVLHYTSYNRDNTCLCDILTFPRWPLLSWRQEVLPKYWNFYYYYYWLIFSSSDRCLYKWPFKSKQYIVSCQGWMQQKAFNFIELSKCYHVLNGGHGSKYL